MRIPLTALALFASGALAAGQSSPWTKVADMPTPRAAHAVTATAAAIYAMGGTGREGTPVLEVDRFDGKAWTTESKLPGEGLNAPAAAAIGDAVYLIGGFGTTTNRPVSTVHRYDARAKTWSEAAPLPAPRGGHAAAVLDGRIHIIGGGNSQSTLDLHTVYDPKTNTWTERAKLPRSMGSPAAVVYDGKLYSIGGRSGPNDFGDVHVYDPAKDAWTPGPSIDPRGTGGAALLNGSIYYFGGESQAKRAVIDEVLRFSPKTNAWSSDAPLPTPRKFGRAVVFKGAIYVVGGSTDADPSHASRGTGVVERFAPR